MPAAFLGYVQRTKDTAYNETIRLQYTQTDNAVHTQTQTQAQTITALCNWLQGQLFANSMKKVYVVFLL